MHVECTADPCAVTVTVHIACFECFRCGIKEPGRILNRQHRTAHHDRIGSHKEHGIAAVNLRFRIGLDHLVAVKQVGSAECKRHIAADIQRGRSAIAHIVPECIVRHKDILTRLTVDLQSTVAGIVFKQVIGDPDIGISESRVCNTEIEPGTVCADIAVSGQGISADDNRAFVINPESPRRPVFCVGVIIEPGEEVVFHSQGTFIIYIREDCASRFRNIRCRSIHSVSGDLNINALQIDMPFIICQCRNIVFGRKININILQYDLVHAGR